MGGVRAMRLRQRPKENVMSVSRRSRAAAAVLATAVLVPTALIGVGSATADSGTGTATVMEQQGPPGQGGHRGPDIARLAAKLGVSTDIQITRKSVWFL